MVTLQSATPTNIWVAPASASAAKITVDVERARQLTTRIGRRDGWDGLAWTPDGRLVFTSAGSRSLDIWLMNADGSEQKQLTFDDGSQPDQNDLNPTVTPDGRYILFASSRTGVPHIWRMNIDGSHQQQLTDGQGETYPRVTPDGHSVIYSLFMLNTLWITPLEGGEATKLIDKPAQRPAISPDGKFIACGYAAKPDAALQIAVFASTGGAPLKLFEVPPTASAFIVVWSPDGRGLVYIDTREGVSNLWLQPLAGGPPTQLTNFKSGRIYNADFSRDSQWVAVARGNSSSDVVLFSKVR